LASRRSLGDFVVNRRDGAGQQCVVLQKTRPTAARNKRQLSVELTRELALTIKSRILGMIQQLPDDADYDRASISTCSSCERPKTVLRNWMAAIASYIDHDEVLADMLSST
jgi:hypothetical protein